MSHATLEREIDVALGRWVGARSGSDLLGAAALATSRAQGQGHVCCALQADAGLSAEQVHALRAHAWVGDGSAHTPFVLDRDGNLYTASHWRHETRLAQALRARAAARIYPLPATVLRADVDELFAGMDAYATYWQRAAVAAVPGARVFVLTGGPGTGKTTTVLRMLLMLLKHARACGLPDEPMIALAAPTGKAAQRLSESIASGAHSLAQTLAPTSAFAAVLDRVAAQPAQTLHRLLDYSPHAGTFGYSANAPLAADIVVADEASMIDLAMMRHLFDALRPGAVLILLGDPAQLYAVEAGTVLGDIAGSVARNAMPRELAQRLSGVLDGAPASDASAAPLAGQVLTLTHGFRAGRELGRALDALRSGDEQWVDWLIASGDAAAVHWHACDAARAVQARVEDWLDAHAAVFARLMQGDVAPGAALRALRAMQILCAVREGAFGVHAVNAALTRRLAARFGFDGSDAWYHGRAIIVTRNDYARGLYNGDVGIALQGADGLRVWFDSAANAAPRSFSPRALPEHETAWAITIHRSQGSEYDDVAVLLPPDAQHKILSRELLYTAVSRARNRVRIWAGADALRAAVARPVARRSGLQMRLIAP